MNTLLRFIDPVAIGWTAVALFVYLARILTLVKPRPVPDGKRDWAAVATMARLLLLVFSLAAYTVVVLLHGTYPLGQDHLIVAGVALAVLLALALRRLKVRPLASLIPLWLVLLGGYMVAFWPSQVWPARVVAAIGLIAAVPTLVIDHRRETVRVAVEIGRDLKI